MKRLLLLVSVCLMELMVVAQTDTTERTLLLLDRAAIPGKITSARRKSDNNNVRGALTDYRAVLDVDSTHYIALYNSADCYYRLKKYQVALDYLNKATATQSFVSSDATLFYGKCYHRLGQLDKAVSYYEMYLKDISPTEPVFPETKRYIQECRYAKSMMAKPVNVKITNLGKEVNSRYEEYSPSVTADGNALYFTSRRANTTGGRVDENADFKFYEDIYFSVKDKNGKWSEAEKVEGKVNTETHDGILSITPDGKAMYVYKNDGKVAGDIYYSKWDENVQEFTASEPLLFPINTKRFESSTSITEDGQFLYFVSEREKGLGRGDIYVSEKKNGIWTEPKNLGPIINTTGDEKFVFVHPNGKSIFFASNGHLSLGGYDLFRSEFINGSWTAPMNLGYPINTVNEESTMSITRDSKLMYLSAEFADSYGERDLYQIDIANYEMASSAEALYQYIEVEGFIHTKRGKGVKGIEVYWMDEYGVEVAKATTDKDGLAKTQIIANRSYQIEIRDGNKSLHSAMKTINTGASEGDRRLSIQLP